MRAQRANETKGNAGKALASVAGDKMHELGLGIHESTDGRMTKRGSQGAILSPFKYAFLLLRVDGGIICLNCVLPVWSLYFSAWETWCA